SADPRRKGLEGCAAAGALLHYQRLLASGDADAAGALLGVAWLAGEAEDAAGGGSADRAARRRHGEGGGEAGGAAALQHQRADMGPRSAVVRCADATGGDGGGGRRVRPLRGDPRGI